MQQGFSEGDVMTLSTLATVRDEGVAAYKQGDPHWVELIDRIRERLHHPQSRLIAEYLLQEKGYDSATATAAEKDAWTAADTYMTNVRPGYREKTQQARIAQTSQGR